VLGLAPQVAFHLRNVFTKTGVTSRGELAHLELLGVTGLR
jgi:DNA-binding CsgD family transcriptional regulator